jgi:membrane protein YdbS with pleckstrin-like domain
MPTPGEPTRSAGPATAFRPAPEVRVTPPETSHPARPADVEEVDVWYGGYTLRSLIGGFLISLAVTLVLLAGAWVAWDRFAVPFEIVSLGVLGLAGAVWLFQLIRWGYRLVTYQIRVTNRRVFFDRGFLYSDRKEWPLTAIRRIETPGNAINRLLNVGCLVLYGEKNPAALGILPGVGQPRTVADLVRQHLSSSAKASPESGRK